jgi:hypothetical protein
MNGRQYVGGLAGQAPTSKRVIDSIEEEMGKPTREMIENVVRWAYEDGVRDGLLRRGMEEAS